MRRGVFASCLCASQAARPRKLFLAKQIFRNLLKHEAVTRRREMVVTQNEEVLIPILVCIGRGEEGGIQIDERLAPAGAKIAPQRNLPAVAVALRKLLRPGIHYDAQGNVSGFQQISQRPHVLQRSRDTRVYSERLIIMADIEARNGPADAGVVGICLLYTSDAAD